MIQNSKLKIQNSQCGFTLIELLLAIAIIATVSVVGFVGFFNYRNAQNLKLSANELATVVRDTQKKSVTQQDGKRWGIRFQKGSDGNQRFSVFNGSAFGVGSTTQSILIRRGVSFGSLFASSTYDMLFAPITGFPLEGKVITLTPGTEKTSVADIIVNIFGKTTLRMENGLVGYWHFDEGVGTTTLDASGNGNNGILSNMPPVWEISGNCKAGKCLSFHDSTDYIEISDNQPLRITSGSWGAWIKSDSWSGKRRYWIDGANHTYMIFTDSPSLGYVYIYLNGNWSQIGFTPPSLNEWHYIMATFDKSFLKVYVDGSLVGTPLAASGDITSTNGRTRIGNYVNDNGSTYTVSGLIDEVRIYNRALSADEVKTIYEDLK